MSNLNYTHIALVLDRSGSMNASLDDTIGGINTLVETQQKEPNRCTMSMYQFDNQFEEVFGFVDIHDVEPRSRKNFVPRGGTALLDAIGRAIGVEKEKREALAEDKRPGMSVLVVVTDGGENSSREFDNAAIKKLITELEGQEDQKVMYIGANVDAFGIGRALGINAGSSANYDQNEKGIHAAYGSVARNLSSTRGSTAMGQRKKAKLVGFSQSDLKAMSNKNTPKA